MTFIRLKDAIEKVEEKLGHSLDEIGQDCVKNAVDGYNHGSQGIEEIKASMREGGMGLLRLGEDDLLSVLDATEEVCDKMRRDGIAQSN